MSMRVEKCNVDDVKARLQKLKEDKERQKNKEKKEYDLDTRIAALQEEDERKKVLT
jgi:hypothetical protein